MTMRENLKSIPWLRSSVRAARAAYAHSYFGRRALFLRDKKFAEEYLVKMCGPDALVHLTEFIGSPYFARKYSFGHSGDFDVMMLYALVRATKPEVVVETGVASGRSSAAILAALEKNGTGKLYSIDLPQYYKEEPSTYVTHEGNNELTGFVPEGKKPGWLVPDALQGRWELILGDAKQELTALLVRLPAVDLFYHDSDHSEEHMRFEFEAMYPKLKTGSFLLSDDVRWNDAWKNFVKTSGITELGIYRNFGMARK